jgi:23S rRNA (cytidine1920-2'-O)/16S rRNA (cytidine1409-2'-O)-methyltransferase
MNFEVAGLTYSPIKGPEGNIEYLVYLNKKKNMDIPIDIENLIETIVENANSNL